MYRSSLLVLPALLLVLPLTAQQPDTRAQNTAADSKPVGVKTNDQIEASWVTLENAVTGTRNTDTRIAAISALAQLGGQARAEKLVGNTLHDPDIDVRLAAIVAAGEMGHDDGPRSNFAPELRGMLNDEDPKVAFTAASTLWKLGDPSGEDILLAVAEGERSGEYNFWKGSRHNATRTLHSPSALAKIAAQQSMVILVPPVGMGMGAYGYLKGTGGTSPQVTAITQIAKEHTEPAKQALIQATKTKDAGARLAATEALAKFRGEDVTRAVGEVLFDSKDTVRYMASATYIRVTTTSTATRTTKAPAKK